MTLSIANADRLFRGGVGQAVRRADQSRGRAGVDADRDAWLPVDFGERASTYSPRVSPTP